MTILRISLCLLILTACGRLPAEDDLLTVIMQAQQGTERVQGTLRQFTTHLDRPDEDGTAFIVTFYLELPDKYHLRYQPEADEEEKEWFLSDGTTQVHAEQMFADEAPEVQRKPVKKDSWGLQRIADFVRMDRASLEEDFDASARPAAEADTAVHSAASNVVELKPKGQIADEIQSITVYLTSDHRTGAVAILDRHDNHILITVVKADYDSPIDPGIFTWGQGE
ncbi:MAG: hypothetical protein PF961_16375 [Planctomycetota bacterium]|jgi:outer membrane lipoprotein-sorting protein|nr:hypothetical protein [Planctomycetota bacterium]